MEAVGGVLSAFGFAARHSPPMAPFTRAVSVARKVQQGSDHSVVIRVKWAILTSASSGGPTDFQEILPIGLRG